jgi:hypothetical protein
VGSTVGAVVLGNALHRVGVFWSALEVIWSTMLVGDERCRCGTVVVAESGQQGVSQI